MESHSSSTDHRGKRHRDMYYSQASEEVHGCPKESQGEIKARCRQRGRQALDYTLLGRFGVSGLRPDWSIQTKRLLTSRESSLRGSLLEGTGEQERWSISKAVGEAT